MNKHITLGREVIYNEDGSRKFGKEVRIPIDLLKDGHVHVRGRTRSGKTSLAIATIVRLLLLAFRGKTDEKPDAMVFIDLGGDTAFFHFVRYIATHIRPKRVFRFFSLEGNEDWDYFDPFQLIKFCGQRLIRICNFLVQSFHLDHGLVYGGAYYTAKSVAALLRVARRVIHQGGDGRDLDLDDIRRYLDEHQERDEDAIRMAIQFLCEYPQLKPPADTDKQIRFDRVIEDGELAYFFLPTLGEATTARQIAGLALYSLVSAAMERQRKGLPLRHVFVFVDEFQELAGPSFSRLLSQSAKSGITLICANQTTSQLNTAGTDLADTVRDNTLLKIYFTVTGKDDIEEIQTFSKDDPNYRLVSESGFGRESQRQVIVAKLKKDGILDASATSQDAFVIYDDTRHREPMAVHFDFSSDAESYRFWKRLPLPMFEGTRGSAPADDATEPRWKTQRTTEMSKARQYAIDRILQRKIAAERPNDE